MRVVLTTDRVALREFTADDVDLLVALDNDPAVMRYINGGLPVPRSEIEHDVLPAFLDWHQRSDAFGFWAATLRATGEFLGWFHLRPQPDDAEGDVELGYRLHRQAWGRGIATEVSRALVDRAFTEHGVQRVRAETMAVNVASRRVMEKSGLRFVRSFHADWPVRIEGDEHGDVEYAIDRDEWLASRHDDY